MTPGDTEFPVLEPDVQIAFYYRLLELRDLYLQDALRETVQKADIPQLDDELAQYATPTALAKLASLQLRGEAIFAVPYLLSLNPFLLGYYRLLYGLSQKEFFEKGPFGVFRSLEARGALTPKLESRLPALCRSLARTADLLVEGIDGFSPQVVYDLQLLTVGPMLRGSKLNVIGQEAVRQVYDLILTVVSPYVQSNTSTAIILKNEAGRKASIIFANDPDVRIVEHLPTGEQPKISIEIKGGADASNVYNRIGEAEKSHLKARQKGYFEFWTIVRAHYNAQRAHSDSPTTGLFFELDKLLSDVTPEYQQFRDRLCSVLNIRVPGEQKRKSRG